MSTPANSIYGIRPSNLSFGVNTESRTSSFSTSFSINRDSSRTTSTASTASTAIFPPIADGGSWNGVYCLNITVHRLERVSCVHVHEAGEVHGHVHHKHEGHLVTVAVRLNDTIVGSTVPTSLSSKKDAIVWNTQFNDIKVDDYHSSRIIVELRAAEKGDKSSSGTEAGGVLVGNVVIPLSQLILDTKVQGKYKFSSSNSKLKLSDTIVLTIQFGKTAPNFIFQMVPLDVNLYDVNGNSDVQIMGIEMAKEKVAQKKKETLKNWLIAETNNNLDDNDNECMDIVKETLLEFRNELDDDSVDSFYLDDLIEEVQSLLPGKLRGPKSNANRSSAFGTTQNAAESLHRGAMPVSDYTFWASEDFRGSLLYDFKCFPYIGIRHKPLEYCGLELHLQYDPNPKCSNFTSFWDNTVYSFAFKNKYSLWRFWKFYMICMDYWSQRVSLTDLPSWITETGELSVSVYVRKSIVNPKSNKQMHVNFKAVCDQAHEEPQKPVEVSMQVSIHQHHMLFLTIDSNFALRNYAIETSLNLRKMSGIVMSDDSFEASSHILEMKLVSVSELEEAATVDAALKLQDKANARQTAVTRSNEENIQFRDSIAISQVKITEPTIYDAMGREMNKFIKSINQMQNTLVNKLTIETDNANEATASSDLKAISETFERIRNDTYQNNYKRLAKLLKLPERLEGASLIPIPIARNAEISESKPKLEFYFDKSQYCLKTKVIRGVRDRAINAKLLAKLDESSLSYEKLTDIISGKASLNITAKDSMWYVVVKCGSSRQVAVVPKFYEDLNRCCNFATIGVNLPNKSNSGGGGGIDVYLFSGSEYSIGTFVGYQQIPASYINSFHKKCFRKQAGRLINLNFDGKKHLSFELAFVSVSGIRSLSGFGKLILMKSLFFECDFVGRYGDLISSVEPVRSKMFSIDSNDSEIQCEKGSGKDYGHNRIVLSDLFGISMAQFIRCKLCVGNYLNFQVVGYIFVPMCHFNSTLHYINNQPVASVCGGGMSVAAAAAAAAAAASITASNTATTTRVGDVGGGGGGGGVSTNQQVNMYNVCRHGNVLEGSGGSKGFDGLGVVSVKLNRLVVRKHEEKKNILSLAKREESLPNLSLVAKLNVKKSSVYSTFWQADCFDAQTDGDASERYYLYPHHTYLALFDEQSRLFTVANELNWDEIENMKIDEEIEKTDIFDAKQDKKAKNKLKMVEIVVFENQRRSFFFPFEFGTGNLTRFERKQFTDETGNVSFEVESLNDIQAPAGFDWSDNWIFDRDYTNTDQGGWTYGIEFVGLQKMGKAGQSLTVQTGMSVRRRKWVRRARIITRASDLTGGGSSAEIPKTWRDEVLSNSPESVISYCQEKNTPRSPVLISWKNVDSAVVVTSSILMIRAIVHQFFGSDLFNQYNSLSIDIYVQNCPASQLKECIDNRLELYSIRSNLSLSLASRMTQPMDLLSLQIHRGTTAMHQTSHSIETKTLLRIDRALEDIENNIAKHDNDAKENRAKLSKDWLVRQRLVACRLKLYSNILLLSGKEAGFKSSYVDISRMICDDLKSCHKNYSNEDDKIRFLMNIAEVRVYESIVSCWSIRSSEIFKVTIETLLNYYFIEVSNLFMGAVKLSPKKKSGLEFEDKLKLVSAFTECVSKKFGKVFNSLLKIYGCKITPHPILENLLLFDSFLEALYGSMQVDMGNVVVLVIANRKSNYNKRMPIRNASSTPWGIITIETANYLPSRTHLSEKIFKLFGSTLPEDISKLMYKYLVYINKSYNPDLPPSMTSGLIGLHDKITSYFIEAYVLFFNICMDELLSVNLAITSNKDKKRTLETDEFDALNQLVDWCESIINDTHRVFRSGLVENKLINMDVLDYENSPFASSPYAFMFRDSNDDGGSIVSRPDKNDATLSVIIEKEAAIEALTTSKIFNTSLKNCYFCMDSVIKFATDNAARTIMTIISMLPSKIKLLDVEFFVDWRQSALKRVPASTGTGASIVSSPLSPESKAVKKSAGILSQYINETFSVLKNKLTALEPWYAKHLVVSCTQRLFVRVLALVKDAAIKGVKISGKTSPEFMQFSDDINEIIDSYSEVLKNHIALDEVADKYSLFKNEEEKTHGSVAKTHGSVVAQLHHSCMNSCKTFITLVGSPMDSSEFSRALASLTDHSTKNSIDARGIIPFIIACMNLRSDFVWTKQFADNIDVRSSSKLCGTVKARRGSVFSFGSGNSDAVFSANNVDNRIEKTIMKIIEAITAQGSVDLADSYASSSLDLKVFSILNSAALSTSGLVSAVSDREVLLEDLFLGPLHLQDPIYVYNNPMSLLGDPAKLLANISSSGSGSSSSSSSSGNSTGISFSSSTLAVVAANKLLKEKDKNVDSQSPKEERPSSAPSNASTSSSTRSLFSFSKGKTGGGTGPL